MRAFIAAQNWLTVIQLPAYAPDLNPVEGIWSLLRRGFLANIVFTSPEHLIRTIRHGLRTIQYRSDLINGCLAGTGLSLTPAQPSTTPRVQPQYVVAGRAEKRKPAGPSLTSDRIVSATSGPSSAPPPCIAIRFFMSHLT